MSEQKLFSESSCLLSKDKPMQQHENPPEPPEPLGSLGSPGIEKPGMDYKFFFTGLLGVFVAFVDDTFVFTTYGTIASHFDSGSMGSWLVTVYNLGFAVTLPLYGRLCDIYGYKYPIQAAYLLFTVGCLMSGFSNSMALAIAGRFFSGAGGSGMTDLLVVIINDMEPPRKATELRSYISIVMTVAVPVGAPLGGALTGWVGWRWAFIMQVPVSLICLIMASWRLQETKRVDLKIGEKTTLRNFNLLGIFLLGLSVASVMTVCQVLSEMDSGLAMKLTIPSSILFASVLIFGINERCWTRAPLIPLKLVKLNKIGAMYIAQFILFFSYGGFASHITEFWIRTENYGNSLAATCILPVIFGNVMSSFISSKIVRRTGRYKRLLIACSVVATVSGILLTSRWPHRPIFLDFLFYFGLGLGVGGILVCTFTALSISVPSHMTATAMTNYYLCQQLGLVLGVAVTSAASRAVFKKCLFQDIPHTREKSKAIGHILNDLRFALSLSEPIQSIAKHCFLQAFRVIPAISSGTLFLSLIVLLRLPEWYLDQ